MNPTDLSSLTPDQRLEIWREATAHLRYLNDEVWKRFQFFLAIDLGLLLAIAFLLEGHPTGSSAMLAILFAISGIVLTVTAKYVLKRNRIYYLQMLLKKTLVENDAGFYMLKLSGTDIDLALPWRLTPEVIETLKNNSEEWIEKNIDAPKTIARRLFQIYNVTLGLFLVLALLAILFTA